MFIYQKKVLLKYSIKFLSIMLFSHLVLAVLNMQLAEV